MASLAGYAHVAGPNYSGGPVFAQAEHGVTMYPRIRVFGLRRRNRQEGRRLRIATGGATRCASGGSTGRDLNVQPKVLFAGIGRNEKFES